ncbi:MAG TPA: tRNA uridine-5-carboxymethylaminomethyl(34) synthesis GTPase MnmE [Gemmatimonadaceae bacterium]|nr:tRNA uridine-5-carboxymethylaminomethyl(34) synthesis GTPase MnmE [Gemmatimonadaceae bacterium]
MRQPALAASLAGGADTIVAVATAPGRGAIAVVRMSGPRALEIARQHIRPWPVEARSAMLANVYDGERSVMLDEAIITTFVGPHSFTGENMVEISTHGGHYVPARVLAALMSSGARPAMPGEFTRRAVLNGKLDITQAEAIGDLIDAGSSAMHRAALGQLDGGLSRRISLLRESIITLESLIAYDIDFPEEDDGPVPRDRILDGVSKVLSALDGLLSTVPAGELIREGAVVVTAGAPNAGKSSLFNSLLGQSRAIVTDIPGTTRDAIEAFLETEKWPLRLVDTAGIRETADAIERIGIEVSERYLRSAHVVLACGDSEQSLDHTVRGLENKTPGVVIAVRTKSDLALSRYETGKSGDEPSVLWVSAETGEGLEQLLARIDEVLTKSVGSPVAEYPLLTRARHVRRIREARDEIAAFGTAWSEDSLPAPVAAVHLRSAVSALEELIGAVSTDDVLDRVFSSFCVGK